MLAFEYFRISFSLESSLLSLKPSVYGYLNSSPACRHLFLVALQAARFSTLGIFETSRGEVPQGRGTSNQCLTYCRPLAGSRCSKPRSFPRKT